MVKRIAFRIVAIVVILAIAYVAASWYVGQQAETIIHNRVVAWNYEVQQSLPVEDLQVTLSIDDYQRHVFTSDVHYTLTVASGDDTQKIRFAGRLVHGPFPYTEVKRGNIQPLMVASYLRLLPTDNTEALFAARSDKDMSPVTARTTLTFQGSGQSVWQFQPLAAEQGTATFSGGTATVTLANQFQDATLNAEFGDFSIAEDGVTVYFHGIGASGETAVTASGAASSALAISVASIATQSPFGQVQTTTDTRLAFSGTLARGLLDGKLEYSVGHMQVGKLDLGEFELAGHVTDVSARALRALRQIAAARASTGGKGLQQPSLQAVIGTLLASQPVVAIDKLHWQMPVGTSAVSLSLHLMQPDQGLDSPLPMLLAEAVQRGELNLSLNKPMLTAVLQQSFANVGFDAAQAGSRVQMIVDQVAAKLAGSGLFVVDGDVLKTTISYEDRAFVVNGKKMALSEFIGHLFALTMAFG